MSKYRCELCGEEYEKGWTDEEAAAESAEKWGVPDPANDPDMAVICDDCWKAMGLG